MQHFVERKHFFEVNSTVSIEPPLRQNAHHFDLDKYDWHSTNLWKTMAKEYEFILSVGAGATLHSYSLCYMGHHEYAIFFDRKK